MEFSVNPLQTEADSAFFQAEEYLSWKENSWVPSDLPEETTRKTFLADLNNYIQDLNQNQVYLAKSERGEYAGMIWMARRTSKEPWDFSELPGWVYDIRVLPEFRRKGLGSQLLAKSADWAREAGFSQVGLHVLGDNTAAIQLYKSSEFRTQYSYYQKEIDKSNLPPVDTRLVARPYRPEVDLDFTRQMLYSQYETRAKASAEPTAAEIVAGFEKCLQTFNFGNSQKELLIADDMDGNQLGLLWFYRSKGDLGKRHYVWLHAALASDPDDLPMLLSTLEHWSAEHELTTIRTPVHQVETRLTKELAGFGYQPANLFMYKCIIE
jgi:ribosomal protein S18 acetylase RimI-like enzyme